MNSQQYRPFFIAGVALASTVLGACAQTPPIVPAASAPASWPAPRDLFSDTWVASDALGRTMPSQAEVGAPKKDKTVGIFYFLWQGTTPDWTAYDITKILAANPKNPAYGPTPSFHWWGEPLFGYYLAYDPFVIRKHAQMLSDAGVDVIVFDNTNGSTYPQAYLPICKVFSEMRAQGIKTPDIAFFPNQKAADQIWNDFYAKNLYPELWFRWKGKPFIQIKPEVNLPAAAADFFSVRRSWAWSSGSWFGDGKEKWPWLDYSPQRPGFDAQGKVEQMSVSIAQHPTSSIGRSYKAGKQPPVDDLHDTTTHGQGIYFDEQWRRVLEVDPEFVFVTGWNEWIAQRFIAGKDGTFAGRPQKQGETFFVDAFTQEFSRDAEPTRLPIGDNYYYQMAANIRRYKGARPAATGAKATIKIDGAFADWNAVSSEYLDTRSDEVQRDFDGWKGLHYTNATGRNDILAAKVSVHGNAVAFYAKTAKPLSTPTGSNWMLLYIDADQNANTGWMGYDFVVNRGPFGAKTTTISANVGGKYEWGKPVNVAFAVRGSELEIEIPLALLGQTKAARFDFKWADNSFEKGDWSDFTLNGDVAPNDRFNYRFTGAK